SRGFFFRGMNPKACDRDGLFGPTTAPRNGNCKLLDSERARSGDRSRHRATLCDRFDEIAIKQHVYSSVVTDASVFG
ncbi:hypothetical protein, partial [Pseudomonas sp. CGJS7]|uniref:hypothetical protein n=1 Tax=Pseudomonas sp. CGJS7 TaxID=3109348 RepID=UPI0030089C22